LVVEPNFPTTQESRLIGKHSDQELIVASSVWSPGFSRLRTLGAAPPKYFHIRKILHFAG